MKVPIQHPEKARRSTRRTRIVVAVIGLAALVLAVFAWNSLDEKLEQTVADMGGTPGSGVFANIGRVVNEAWPRQRAATSEAPPLPSLHFDVKFKYIEQLRAKRKEALRRNYLIQEEDDFVPATIRLRHAGGTHEVRARIRLKGDFTDHLVGEKWSFRVKVKGDGQILGMRVFSIQHPKVRGYAHEALFMEHVRRENLLAPRYSFVRFALNGNDKGIMALEEHFSKELIESQGRRESVLVRFDEDLKWRTLHLMGQEVNFAAPYPLIKPFRSTRVASNPQLQRDLDTTVGLLRAFLSKDLRPSQVFDPEVTARFLAVAEVWGAEHILAWNNLRFYYNPITGLIEPVAFDANLQDYAFRYISTTLVSMYDVGDQISTSWLADPRIRAPFLRELQRIATEFQTAETQETLVQREQDLCAILHQEFPLIPAVPLGFYKMRADRLLKVDESNYDILPLMPPAYPALMHAFVQRAESGWQLEIYNLVPYPLAVTAITCQPASVTCAQKFPVLLPPTRDLTAPPPLVVDLTSSAPLKNGEAIAATVTAHIPGYPDSERTLPARSYSPTVHRPVLPETDWEEVLTTHRDLKRSADGKTARLGPGRIELDEPLVLPRGVSLEVAPGTTLAFARTALLLVHGAVRMRGTAAAPIRLVPKKQNGWWRGVAVLGRDTESTWSHVEVSRTNGLALGSWRPTGSVMFHDCEVRLENCSFTQNRSEDAINLVHCLFNLEGVEITDASSDAIDMDFCHGVIRGGHIRRTGGDGIDVSGTVIEVAGTHLEAVKDKALSVGERSDMRARGVRVEDAGTGLASKDGAKARLEDCQFDGITYVAVMAFTKKKEFGPGAVTATNVVIKNAKSDYRAQTGSTIEVDGKGVTPEDLDVDALYRAGPMRKER